MNIFFYRTIGAMFDSPQRELFYFMLLDRDTLSSTDHKSGRTFGHSAAKMIFML